MGVSIFTKVIIGMESLRINRTERGGPQKYLIYHAMNLPLPRLREVRNHLMVSFVEMGILTVVSAPMQSSILAVTFPDLSMHREYSFVSSKSSAYLC